MRKIGHLTQKKGTSKLPLFCGNVERLIPIYGKGGASGNVFGRGAVWLVG